MNYLNQRDAAALDEELMGDLRFSVDQLMELAGLSVATAIESEYPSHSFPRVLVVAGPGNNGGDGLVAARHLTHFGHTVQVAYPRPSNKILYNNLLSQCKTLNIKNCDPDVFADQSLKANFDLILDAVFGFSFKGTPRPPFDTILEALKPEKNPPKIVSVDIPSGWHVENGDESGNGIRPDMLVSLSAPKACARFFKGSHHYLGGRFIPPSLAQKFNLNIPEYPLASQCVKLNNADNLQSMRASYKTPGLDVSDLHPDPIEQFKIWFDEFSKLNITEEPNAMVVATCGTDMMPSARFVLLKGLEKNGFVFYTNYGSKKGQQLEQNPRAALCFYMDPLKRQVRIEGKVTKLSESESAEYFSSRPRESQKGAWASRQSSVLSDRDELEDRAAEIEKRFADESIPIPKPPYWGGFLISPLSIEFWQGREGRMHDRLQYFRDDVESSWNIRRLSP